MEVRSFATDLIIYSGCAAKNNIYTLCITKVCKAGSVKINLLFEERGIDSNGYISNGSYTRFSCSHKVKLSAG